MSGETRSCRDCHDEFLNHPLIAGTSFSLDSCVRTDKFVSGFDASNLVSVSPKLEHQR